MKKYNWKKLNRQQVGSFCEYYVKMEFTMYGFQVYTTEIDDRGIDFVVRYERCDFITIQVKSIRESGYVFLQKNKFKIEENSFLALVILNELHEPNIYLIPSMVWNSPNSIFVSRDYVGLKSKPEWGINLSKKNIPQLCDFKFSSIAQVMIKKSRADFNISKSVYECFNEWRNANNPINNWGFAWFLANEFCKRFYSSHGIIPQVISHEGLGYYGIQLDKTRCIVNNGNEGTLGRFTMFGNVENWSTGGPGDHGLNAIKICENGENIESIIKKAISHMRIPEIPTKTHLNCRHKRWGSSFQLLFEIATILAMEYNHETIEIWNHPYHTQRFIDKLDPKSKMNEHLGAFLFRYNDTEIIFASDGRELSGTQDDNYWYRYMSGETPFELFENLSQKLKL